MKLHIISSFHYDYIYLQDSANREMGVHHHVSQIIGFRDSNTNLVHPSQFSRLPLFHDVRSGGYALELAGVYEVISEYYRLRSHPEYLYYEEPYKRVYTYYLYEGGNTPLREILLGLVPSTIMKNPFCRAVEHLDGAS